VGARRRRRFAPDRWRHAVCPPVWDETSGHAQFFLTPQDGSRIEPTPPVSSLTFRIDTPEGRIEAVL